MEEVPENVKELSHSARADGISLPLPFLDGSGIDNGDDSDNSVPVY
jgi:hypothetical protein